MNAIEEYNTYHDKISSWRLYLTHYLPFCAWTMLCNMQKALYGWKYIHTYFTQPVNDYTYYKLLRWNFERIKLNYGWKTKILEITIVSFILHIIDGFNKTYFLHIPDRAQNKWLASHTSIHSPHFWSKLPTFVFHGSLKLYYDILALFFM